MSDTDLILIAGLLLAAGIAAAKVADRVRVPGLLLFLGLGMLIGSEGIGGVQFNDAELTRTLGTIGLILILFEGGLTAGWGEIRPVLGTAISLATVGTVLTAVLTGLAAIWLFDLSTLEGLLIGSAVAATDSAAIFAVLRGSRLRRPLARTLEGESGMNDPVALLLVTGFIDWIQLPDYGPIDMVSALAWKLALGLALGLAIGFAARWCFRHLDLPSPGLYPVASIATAALAYGVPELLHGSGFLSVYIAALILGTGPVPAHPTTVAFHQGLAWVAQISLFALLGLLVFPSGLGDIAVEGLALSAALMFVARPAAAFIASALSPFDSRERLMLGWAGLRGAIPIWLATFPVIAGIDDGQLIFNAIFFVVVTSTLIQGATFEPLARRLGLTSTEPALPEPLIETGIIRQLGGETLVWRVAAGNAAVGQMVKDLGLPREALVNLIVRGGGGDPAAGIDRDRGRRRDPRRRPGRAAARGRGAHRSLAQRAARRAGGPGPAAPRRPAGVLGPPLARRGRRPGPPHGARGRGRRRPAARPPRRARLAGGARRRSLRGHLHRPARARRPPAARRVVRAPDRPRRAQPAGAGLAAGGGGSARRSARPRPQTGRLSAGR